MNWTESYEFREPLIDLRAFDDSREALTAELLREVAPGHELHGLDVQIVARALPNDDVVIVADDRTAIVHLTWTSRKAERPPWPKTRFVSSAEEFETYVESEFGDWQE